MINLNMKNKNIIIKMMNTKNNIKTIKMKCPYCGYEWESRTRNPKACPLCKRYIIEKPGEQ